MARKIFDVKIVNQTKRIHSASVIFLHGSGGCGSMCCDCIRLAYERDLCFPHIRILYPTAPQRPYTLAAGSMMHVWFDRKELSQDVPEDLTTIEPMAEKINQLIDQEVKQGINIDRIILGGFSMGGGMALEMGYRFRPDIGGIIACSSFLNTGSKVYEVLHQHPEVRRPPLLMCHGIKDDMVAHEWGDTTFKQLQALGVSGTFHTFQDLFHTMSAEEILVLQNWILQRLPEKY